MHRGCNPNQTSGGTVVETQLGSFDRHESCLRWHTRQRAWSIHARAREHQPESFTAFLIGGGVKPGFSRGETDEIGDQTVGGRVHVLDLHATMLNPLGLNHEKRTYRHAGRDDRLTDVYGKVDREILA